MPGFLILLDQSIDLYKKNFALLAGYMAWLLLPYATLVLFSLPTPSLLTSTLSSISLFSQALIGLWLGVLIPLVVNEVVLKKPKINLVILQNKAWSILPSVIFVAILELAVFLGGFILLIIPSLIFWVWFAMAQLAVTLDNKKGLAAMSWSRELVRGRFWETAWRILAGPFLISLTFNLAILILLIVLALIFQIPTSQIFSETPPLWADIISMVIQTFSLPIILIYYTLLYLNLSKTKTSPQDETTTVPEKI